MNFKGTFYLTVLALGMLAYILLLERHTLDTQQRAERGRKVFPDFDAGDVASLEILRSNEVIRVERTNDQWRLTRPVVYPAQSTVIGNWLALFHTLDRRGYISAEELQTQPGGLAAFGLAEPQATVVVQQGQKKLQLRLGARTPIGEKLYLQRVGSAGVFVTGSALLDRLPRSDLDWRDPVFLRLDGLGFDRLSVRAGARELAVEREPGGRRWRLTIPRSARADNGLVQQLLQQLQSVRVGRFVSDSPGNDLEAYGLQTPEVALAFARGTNTVLTVEFGRATTNDATQVHARRSNYPMIVTVPRALLELLRVPYTDFLDRRLVELRPAAVDRIEARAAQAFSLQRQPNAAWQIIQPFDAPADPALVQGFLERLNSLQIVDSAKDVVTDSDWPSYGFSPPTRQYIMKGRPSGAGTRPVLAQVDFGTNQSDKLVYVRRSDENSVYTARVEESQLLPQAAFELRDRRIWSFTTNQVVSVTIEFKGKSYRLQRNGDGRWGFAENSQGMFYPVMLEEAMFRFGQLRSKAWDACGLIDPARYGFGDPPHKLSIELNTGDKPRTLTVEFGGESPSGGPYAAVDLEGGRTVFDLPSDIFSVYNEVVRNLTATFGAAP